MICMSWENIVKSTTRRADKIVWPSMKNLIDIFFEENEVYDVHDLKNYLISNLKEQVRKERTDITDNHIRNSVVVVINDLKGRVLHSKYMAQKVPRYIRSKYNRARIDNGNTYELLSVEKSWDSTLKGSGRSASRKLVEKTIQEMVEEYVKDKDIVYSVKLKEHIIANLKTEHLKRHTVDGKIAGHTSSAPTRYINSQLENSFPQKVLPMVRKLGFEIVYATERRDSYLVRKSDSWESMVDSMIAEDKLFDAIYTAILQKYKFSSPSKEKIVAYLNANYERHPLFSNKWSTKSEGDGQ